MAIKLKTKPTAHYWVMLDPDVRAKVHELLTVDGQPPQPAALMFTAYLLNSARDRDLKKNELHYVVASHERIQECRGLPIRKGRAHTREDASGPWLDEYCALVGTDYTDHTIPGLKSAGGKRRRVNAAFLEGLRVRPTADARERYVHVVTGLPLSAYALSERIPFSNEIQRKIARYIDSLPRELYYPEPGRFARALDLSAGVADDIELLACSLSPPRYEASAGGNTERLHAAGWSALSKPARRALTEWTELDLVSAHAAAFVKLAADHRIKMPILSSLLDAGDAWLGACELVDLGPEHRDAVKELCIKALFGRSQANLRSDCEEAGLSTKIPHKPLFAEVIEARNRLAALAEQQKFLKGPGGRRNHLKERGATALLHSVCSDYELQLVEPIYDVALRCQDAGCFIALHEHDGVEVGGPEGALEQFIGECQAAVAARAEQLGVRTRLVVKHKN